MQYLTYQPIQIEQLLAISHHTSCGAVVLFSGDVRNNNVGKQVDYLEFEAFDELAKALIAEILDTAQKKWNLEIALCQHRLGIVKVLECAVCVVTSSPHRSEAYQANQYIMERIKHEVPIWKKEVYTDKSYQWGNNCGCHPEGYFPENHTKSVPQAFQNLK